MNKQLEFATIDYVILGATALLTLSSFLYIGMEYAQLPDRIPTHFDHLGKPNGYSGKSTLWFVTILLTALSAGTFLLAKATHFHNTQLKDRISNFRMVAVFMPFIAFIQLIVVYTMIQSAQGEFVYSSWMLPIILVLTAICIALMFIIISKNKKS